MDFLSERTGYLRQIESSFLVPDRLVLRQMTPALLRDFSISRPGQEEDLTPERIVQDIIKVVLDVGL
jgi:hypothetical protein